MYTPQICWKPSVFPCFFPMLLLLAILQIWIFGTAGTCQASHRTSASEEHVINSMLLLDTRFKKGRFCTLYHFTMVGKSLLEILNMYYTVLRDVWRASHISCRSFVELTSQRKHDYTVYTWISPFWTPPLLVESLHVFPRNGIALDSLCHQDIPRNWSTRAPREARTSTKKVIWSSHDQTPNPWFLK